MRAVSVAALAALACVAYAGTGGATAKRTAAEDGVAPAVDVPFAAAAPTIDGIAAPGEWDISFRVIGAGTPVDARMAEIRLSWDERRLYILSRSETAPRGRLETSAGSLPGTDRIVMDDSVELWFDPPKEMRRADEAKRFGSFQMIVNHKGDTYGRHHSPGYGLPARDWRLDDVKMAWTVTNDVWTLEMAIPASAFGLRKFAPCELPLLAVRNFRLQSGRQAPFLRPGGGFAESTSYPKMRLSRSARPHTLDRRPPNAPRFAWNTPEANVAADAGATGVRHGVVKGVKIPVPGSFVMRVNTMPNAEKKGYRRYFSTEFRPSGYLGFQEDANNGRTMLFFAHHFKDVPPLNKRLKCPAPRSEAVVAVNFEPRRISYYLNGIRQGETDLTVDISEVALGDLVLGGERDVDVKDWTLYRRTLSDGEVKELSQGDSPIAGTLAWYPSLNALVADVTCNAERLKGADLAWSVTRRGGSMDAAPVAKGTLPLAGGYPSGALTLLRKVLPLGVELAEGDYVASLMRSGETDAILEKEFSVRKYAWFKTGLGKEDRLLPGFTPVEADGDTLRCVGRRYVIGANGFPSSVVADGEQILAAPVALHAEKDGRRWMIQGGSAKPRLCRVSDTRAEYSSAAAGYSVSGSLEQDGLLRFTIDFADVAAADRIWLEIPLKGRYATLYHACGEGVRANPAGFVPKGNGVVFKSRDIPQTHVSNFIPYCWVGTDTRGLAYAADTDLGWAHSGSRDAVELHRAANGDVSIVLNLLNDAKKVAGRRIELALMASPVKPMPKGWRGWSDGFGYRGTRTARCLAAPLYWGNYTGWAARYPAWGDFAYVRKLREAIDTGRIDNAYLERWIDRVCGDASSETAWVNGKDPESARKTVSAHTWSAFHTARSLHGQPDPILYFYTCDADSAKPLAEYVAFRDEWENCKVAIPSYADYAIWNLDRMLEAGMGGIYDDNTFICCNFNWATGEAKVDESGTVHPSFGIWNSREYRRRQANVLVSRGRFPWITVHHTNGNILPALGFAANSMGMEWKYGTSDFQTRFTPDYIRAVCQGLQGGLFPTALDGITGFSGAEKRPDRIRVTRTMLASLLVHEVRPVLQRGSDAKTIIDVMNRLMDFGIDAEDCEYTAYWNDANPVICTDSDVLVSVYRRGARLLAVCGSWADGDRDVALSLRSGEIRSAKNAETDASLSVADGKVHFSLRKNDLALLEIQSGSRK